MCIVCKHYHVTIQYYLVNKINILDSINGYIEINSINALNDKYLSLDSRVMKSIDHKSVVKDSNLTWSLSSGFTSSSVISGAAIHR